MWFKVSKHPAKAACSAAMPANCNVGLGTPIIMLAQYHLGASAHNTAPKCVDNTQRTQAPIFNCGSFVGVRPQVYRCKKPISSDNDILTIPKRIGTTPCRYVTYICTQRHRRFLAICDVTTGCLHPQNDIPCLTVLQGRRSIWLSSGNLCLTHETHHGHRTITGQQQHERNHKTPREGNPSKIPSLFVSEPLASSDDQVVALGLVSEG